MGYNKKFTQQDYGTLVGSLDMALAIFEKSDNPEAALKDFVLNHYFKVWRAMAPKVPNGERGSAA
jgi:hypothetical protein